MTQYKTAALEEVQQTVEDVIEDRIIELFQQLSTPRRKALLEELTQIWDSDVEDDGNEPSFHGDHFD